MENTYKRTIFYDIETAGLALDAPIIEVAAVATESGTYRFIESIDMKIQFDMSQIDNFDFLGVNKFTPSVWEQYAIPELEAAKKLASFFKRHATVERTSKKGNYYTVAKLAGHNADKFDTPRLSALFERNELFFPALQQTLCTMQLAEWFFDRHPHIEPPENSKLQTIIEFLSLDARPDHTALADTLATVDLAIAITEFWRRASLAKVA